MGLAREPRQPEALGFGMENEIESMWLIYKELFYYFTNEKSVLYENLPLHHVSYLRKYVTYMRNTEQLVAGALRNQIPVAGLAGVSITDVRERSDQPFDLTFDLRSGQNRVQVLAEVKTSFSPRTLEEIAPWIRRLKALKPDAAVAVIAPSLSPQSQAYCVENGMDFLDLAGNLSINVPGKFTLQRTGMRRRDQETSSTEPRGSMNVFSGRSSRILRVLLEKPKNWTITEIAQELAAEEERFRKMTTEKIEFRVSVGMISKVISALEEQLLLRKRNTTILVPEPGKLLREWAEKYTERYRWRLRSSFQTENPFGTELEGIAAELQRRSPGTYAFTSEVAASTQAPFVDIQVVDIFVLSWRDDRVLRGLTAPSQNGPKLRFISPFDEGVFMYARRDGEALIASPIQVYLDLYAKGGRDLKQADYLLSERIQPGWSAA